MATVRNKRKTMKKLINVFQIKLHFHEYKQNIHCMHNQPKFLSRTKRTFLTEVVKPYDSRCSHFSQDNKKEIDGLRRNNFGTLCQEIVYVLLQTFLEVDLY